MKRLTPAVSRTLAFLILSASQTLTLTQAYAGGGGAGSDGGGVSAKIEGHFKKWECEVSEALKTAQAQLKQAKTFYIPVTHGPEKPIQPAEPGALPETEEAFLLRVKQTLSQLYFEVAQKPQCILFASTSEVSFEKPKQLTVVFPEQAELKDTIAGMSYYYDLADLEYKDNLAGAKIALDCSEHDRPVELDNNKFCQYLDLLQSYAPAIDIHKSRKAQAEAEENLPVCTRKVIDLTDNWLKVSDNGKIDVTMTYVKPTVFSHARMREIEVDAKNIKSAVSSNGQNSNLPQIILYYELMSKPQTALRNLLIHEVASLLGQDTTDNSDWSNRLNTCLQN